MSLHISASAGDIAETVLLPGDPLRAQFVAETFLENPVCYTKVRGMFGFTGTYKGKRVSVQGTGMGMPSHGIYVHELINSYGAKRLIRIGTCGAYRKDIPLKSVVLAMSASTDSAMNSQRFKGMSYAPTADFSLLLAAHEAAKRLGVPVFAGGILSADTFYDDEPDAWKLWAEYGVLAVEMETAILYTLAAKFGVKALSVLTVSDNFPLKSAATHEERQAAFQDMMKVALEIS
ncbi:MAG: purine-nucleoside phosphorylase [Spirochaetales bacterium]|jgi:purine-nucleoside phosphorylase|nr:purine-nucleoside phosphorylase [Spirochaetales bacterium]